VVDAADVPVLNVGSEFAAVVIAVVDAVVSNSQMHSPSLCRDSSRSRCIQASTSESAAALLLVPSCDTVTTSAPTLGPRTLNTQDNASWIILLQCTGHPSALPILFNPGQHI
jgi:hypothetical protein